ncbi:hypothetical protein CXF68_13360 [Tenacibaculum sp. Bg11-29]|uniref:helix-turn-helix domain-containing protein n=1 Tax=Tenacibaculum sp. Bg11-29 TaxID=2058306 RepID=UPI000C329D28|nr:helix-turn-helix domain-containing protein [Tenacibaculum sp. Bg11-29]PKH51608.1 hypothetical protein CXF68_13360 [Tenacibaculum sp. Bg11-29]
MENKNLLTMKQPALGKRISELRKQKGLTQEELVEKCNINVRTIQRIEAGETIPRSFTIKTILQALDADINVDNIINEIEISNNDRKVLNLAWIFGIIYFVFGVIETIADVYHITQNEMIFGITSYACIKVISAITFVLFFMGFIKLAKKYSSKLLEVIVYVFMITYVFSELYDIFLISSSNETIIVTSIVELMSIVELIIFGTIQIIFGLSLLQLKTKFDSLIKVNGILEIITGICVATVVLSSIGLFFLIPTIIIEVVVLYKFAKS